ncbi:uncharacterized protein L3040_003713 [Drepanopeziza brunnea f. sp. 'multigermtubi']|uniref:Uncharacterized protein n=1 Tax=Marssonina brunnea f. sp. multigermtubi (strain MB_m1) TaxID=1072389 RepID=K1WQ14_MARBU|nr:uncharacterized protein MBM_06847 [Drepanopeziza brunnea f. sp. 'multigermtubi' MB_m1]EKD15086.1 hypothetical protein MBM_06847 [Drepanopeziza brunnea f. sp. 'multigermtubi' MB_m1]KAJ5046470.1 hypothetical protein L3040_003713 [Drepanopeziza brunnea f. sp. 'multigermtubi']
MFSVLGNIGLGPAPNAPRVIPPRTPVKFPQFTPQSEEKVFQTQSDTPLVELLQKIHRPADIKPSVFEAVGIHVIPDASPQDLTPDASYLPPFEQWNAIPACELSDANWATQKCLSNGGRSPGAQTYRERRKELLIDNTAAFRSIRRMPAPKGETNARLGNAYEFYKHLEFLSGYWPDTSLPPEAEPFSTDAEEKDKSTIPIHMRTHVAVGNGAQLPPDCRQHLITAFVRLVAWDFGCNVSPSRTEPRLLLTPSPRAPPHATRPPTTMVSSAHFIYRLPGESSVARCGIVEGPVAAVSARATHTFATPLDETLDLTREIVAILITAQQRARSGKTEKRFGEGKWWTSTPRWGGGPGGPIGKEGDKAEEDALTLAASGVPEKSPVEISRGVEENAGVKMANEVKRQIGGIADRTPTAGKRLKKGKDGNLMAMYQTYRKMNPPSAMWDRNVRYEAIGKVQGTGYDDIFLISALNHHVCVVRARVPEALMDVLGGEEREEWERVVVWRSRWWDLYLGVDRVEAMEAVWGLMNWLLRDVGTSARMQEPKQEKAAGGEGEEMDLS